MYTNDINLKLVEMKSMMNILLDTMESLKEKVTNKIYTIEELCDYLKVGRSVIENYRRNGELSYSKIGRTYIYTQKDVEELLERNKIKYVS